MSNDATHVVIGVVILLAAALKLLQLRRAGAGTDRAAVVAMCVAVAAIGAGVLQDAVSFVQFLFVHLGINFTYAERHTPMLVAVGCVPIVFLCWLQPAGPVRRRRVRLAVAVLVAVVAARWVLAATASPADAWAALTGDWTHAPRTVPAVLLYTLYTGASVGWAAVMARRWARRLRSERPSTALGLRLLVVAGLVFGVYLLHKVVFMAYVLLTRVPPPYNPEVAQYPVVIGACVLLASGICIPLVASVGRAVIERLRQLRAHRRLRPLWAALTAHHPGVVMPLTPSWLPAGLARAWDALDPREVELRLFRRTIECWDVLTGLGGHLDARVHDEAWREADDAGAGERAPAVATAVMIRHGLARATAAEPALEPRHRAGAPMRDGELADNVAWWQAVATQWEDPLTLRLATVPSVATTSSASP